MNLMASAVALPTRSSMSGSERKSLRVVTIPLA